LQFFLLQLKIVSFIGVPKQKNLTLNDDTSVS